MFDKINYKFTFISINIEIGKTNIWADIKIEILSPIKLGIL